MQNLLKPLLDLNYLRKIWGFEVFSQAIKDSMRLNILKDTSEIFNKKSANILVLAPHPDDDTFACGGSLAQHSQNDQQISVIYLCDGSKGTIDGKINSSLIELRKNEAKNANQIIGVNDSHFWKFKDGKLSANKTAINLLRTHLLKFKPDLIYVPNLVDNHPDHLATNEILYKALKIINKKQEFNPLISQYELWTPVFPNRIIDITNVHIIKNKAMLCHQSQLKTKGYANAINSLNSYRAQINGINGYAEAYLITSFALYSKLYNLVRH
ncbi:MAG: PIG-L family deacetylase [Patescibacteria group bacterium]|nr:PIG-L family deacetylase [Patescibacteria group bacterium]